MKRIALLLTLVTLLLAVGCTRAVSREAVAASPAPTPVSPLSLSLVQTTFNTWTRRQTQKAFDLSVEAGGRYTVESDSRVWTLTFEILEITENAVSVRTAHPMLAYRDGERESVPASEFTIPLGTAYYIDEREPDITAGYAFLFTLPDALADIPQDAVLLTQPQVLSNVRRTLHERDKFYFTNAELSLILFVDLSGGELHDLSELNHLPNVETLTLDKTRVCDLSPLAALTSLRELTLTGNRQLDLATMPSLPSLSSLTLDERPSGEVMNLLQTRLPACSISIINENEDA